MKLYNIYIGIRYRNLKLFIKYYYYITYYVHLLVPQFGIVYKLYIVTSKYCTPSSLLNVTYILSVINLSQYYNHMNFTVLVNIILSSTYTCNIRYTYDDIPICISFVSITAIEFIEI